METITVKKLKERQAAGETLHLVDVRESDERAEFNIGGTFLPLGNILSMQTDDIAELQDEEIICYCRSGKRSMQAALMLESLGFSKVKSLEGGTMAWQESTA